MVRGCQTITFRRWKHCGGARIYTLDILKNVDFMLKTPLSYVTNMFILIHKSLIFQSKPDLNGYSSQREVNSINVHMYNVLVVRSNRVHRSSINN